MSALLVFVASVAVSGPASAQGNALSSEQKSALAAGRGCGFNTDEYYRHCDPNTRVLMDARNFWGTTYRDICVGYGDTYLGDLSYWRIVNAWYNGRTC